MSPCTAEASTCHLSSRVKKKKKNFGKESTICFKTLKCFSIFYLRFSTLFLVGVGGEHLYNFFLKHNQKKKIYKYPHHRKSENICLKNPREIHSDWTIFKFNRVM